MMVWIVAVIAVVIVYLIVRQHIADSRNNDGHVE
jgi:hypothetical protein